MVILLRIKTTRLLNEASGALFICRLSQGKLKVRTSVLIQNRLKARPYHARTLTPEAAGWLAYDVVSKQRSVGKIVTISFDSYFFWRSKIMKGKGRDFPTNLNQVFDIKTLYFDLITLTDFMTKPACTGS